MITLTKEQLNKYTKNLNTSCIALNKEQLELLGIDWPPKNGWIKTLIGLEINILEHDELLRLKDKKLNIKQKVISRNMKRIEKEVDVIGGKVFWDIKL